MKILSLLLFVMTGWASVSGLKWQALERIENPESVYFDSKTGLIFVSNIAGDGVAKDGRGWILKLNSDGEAIGEQWVTGLNAPKGMRAQDGTLWVTDIDTVIAIDINSGKILRRISISGAVFLNDVAITEKGEVFVSDTLARKIYRIRGETVETFYAGDQTESPNGLLVEGNRLIVAAWGLAAQDWSTTVPGNLYALDLNTKKKTLITKKPLGNLDGLEITEDGHYIVSDWTNGKIYQVSTDGKVTQIPVSPAPSSADIGYNPNLSMLIIPYMNDNRVDAYDLKYLR